MKILVDKMVDDPRKCFFSKWKPNPPIIEEPGYFICTCLNIECNLQNKSTECYCFKENKNE